MKLASPELSSELPSIDRRNQGRCELDGLLAEIWMPLQQCMHDLRRLLAAQLLEDV